MLPDNIKKNPNKKIIRIRKNEVRSYIKRDLTDFALKLYPIADLVLINLLQNRLQSSVSECSLQKKINSASIGSRNKF